MNSQSDLFARFKQPAFTGENRCLPCTIVNLVIALLLSIGVSIAVSVQFDWGWLSAIGAAGSLFAICLITTYLQGYLVPGTPWLTRTYLPDSILRRFDHHRAHVTRDADGLDLEQTLRDAGIVEDCPERSDICLDDAFEKNWTDRIESLRTTEANRDDLATFLDLDPDAITFEQHGDAFLAYENGVELAQWESHAAYLADMAAVPELRARIVDWNDIGPVQQSRLLHGLRSFLPKCPACGGMIVGGERRVRSCCRSYDVLALGCGECESRLFEVELPT